MMKNICPTWSNDERSACAWPLCGKELLPGSDGFRRVADEKLISEYIDGY